MTFTVENTCGFLIRSKLMTPEEMRAMYQRWQADSAENVGSLPHFLRWLVTQKYVTEYQANLLHKGHADDFFLGPYKVLDRIGRGRMAGVYKAAHALTGQLVAIKVLPPSRAKNPQILARFDREARLSVKLKHPNVVRTFQIGEARGLHWLVMEHLEGETLEEVLARRKRLPPHEAVRLAHQALTGLQNLHEMGMVHRDLKPANLMLVQNGAPKADVTDTATIKILDIGLARSLFAEDEDNDLTAEGMLLGTPDYLAPEQARDPRSSDIRADVYSLGCVLYHALTGQPPFPDKNILNQIIRHATENPAPIRKFNPEVSEGLEQIVGYMMAKDPSKRYPTPERAALGLQVFMMADARPAAPIEESPQLRCFLTTLEIDAAPAAEAPGAWLHAPATASPVQANPVPPSKPPANAGLPAAATPKAAVIAAASPVMPPAGAATPPPPSNAILPAAPLLTRKDTKSTKASGQAVKKKSKGKPVPIGKPAVPPTGTSFPAFATSAENEVSEGFDVELVPEAAIPWNPSEFSRRDWILVTYGAAVVAFLGLFVFGLTAFFRRRPADETPSDGKQESPSDGKTETKSDGG